MQLKTSNRKKLQIFLYLVTFLLVLSLGIIIFLHFYVERLYQQNLKAAKALGLHVKTHSLVNEFPSNYFTGTDLFYEYIQKMESALNVQFVQEALGGVKAENPFRINIDSDFLQQLPETPFAISTDRIDKYKTVKPIIDDFYEAINNSQNNRHGIPTIDSIHEQYSDRKFFIDYLVVDILAMTTPNKKEIVDAMHLLHQSLSHLSHETPYLITSYISYNSYNKYIDVIYLLHVLNKIDTETATELLQRIDFEHLDSLVKNAMKTEYNAINQDSNFYDVSKPVFSRNPLSNVYIKANRIGIVQNYIEWIQASATPYFKLPEHLKENRISYSNYLVLMENHVYPWQKLIMLRDMVKTRIELLHVCLALTQQSDASIPHSLLSTYTDYISGLPFEISNLNSTIIVHSSILDKNNLTAKITLCNEDTRRDQKHRLKFLFPEK